MSKHKTVEAFLKCARRIVAKGWTQRTYAVTRNGNRADVCAPSAARFCMLGAIRRCDRDMGSPIYRAAYRAMQDHVPRGNVANFNDTHTKKEVLAVFDRAIKAAK